MDSIAADILTKFGVAGLLLLVLWLLGSKAIDKLGPLIRSGFDRIVGSIDKMSERIETFGEKQAEHSVKNVEALGELGERIARIEGSLNREDPTPTPVERPSGGAYGIRRRSKED